jgi:DNA segregation ATPase FtsK/SpoIIIE, S-DNA-T family
MAKKKRKKKNKDEETPSKGILHDLKEETVQGILAVSFFAIAILLGLSALGSAGVFGAWVYDGLSLVFGIGYYLLPVLLVLLGVSYFRSFDHKTIGFTKLSGASVFLLAGLGFIEIAFEGTGGIVGNIVSAPLISFIDVYATVVLLITLLVISLLVIMDAHLQFDTSRLWGRLFKRSVVSDESEPTVDTYDTDIEDATEENADEVAEIEDEYGENVVEEERSKIPETKTWLSGKSERAVAPGVVNLPISYSYTPPPLSLLEKDKGKPGIGDTKANANIIKRTLGNFGIIVEVDEITVGPTVTRYALSPAEGVRISKIVSLQGNLELALAASPVRIEAPIPGRSLVGIEVPNSAKTTLGLASLFSAPEFIENEKPLIATIGRDITGSPHYIDISKMPHLLIAGATGSGKSVMIHDLIVSLLYKSGPDILRFIMVDPKRVELTLYNNIPHLLTPVVTDPKKTILALKWATKEMDRRYDILEAEQVRDIKSYHTNIVLPSRGNTQMGAEDISGPEPMPYIVIVIDELADIMQAYPRELEAAVVRLAQMSRAVGIHLVLSTQRPSVNVITGLIKANVPSRIALQVASQIDSRTILDSGGAEKLLGAGDMLYLSGEMSKPLRIQSPFISETEVKKIASFVKNNNSETVPSISFSDQTNENAIFSSTLDEEDDGDALYEEAKEAVVRARKASTSYLQRKLRVGYARAARLIDILEERGVIGPADGSRPRDVITHEDNTNNDSATKETEDSDEENRYL